MKVLILYGVEITQAERYVTVTRPGCAHEVAAEYTYCPMCGRVRQIKIDMDRGDILAPYSLYGNGTNHFLGVRVFDWQTWDPDVVGKLDGLIEAAREIFEEGRAQIPADLRGRKSQTWIVVESE